MRSTAALWLLLWRWLPLRRRWGIIQLIALLSLLGIGIGTATLLSVQSIFKGFHRTVQTLLLRYEPHLQLLPAQGQWLTMSPESLASYAQRLRARAFMPVISGRILVRRGGSFAPATLLGVPPEALQRTTNIPQSILIGHFSFAANGRPAALVGAGLAERLHLLPGDTLWLWTPQMLEQVAIGLPVGPGFALMVSGVFQATAAGEQGFALYTDTATARRLFGLAPHRWSSIDLWLARMEDVPEVHRHARLPATLRLLPWYERHRQLYEVLRLERLGTFAVLSLVVLVAVFNVAAALQMSAVQKRRELALLHALGMPTRQLQRLYLRQGLLLGSAGVCLGLLGGLSFYWGQLHFGWIRLDPTRYILSTLPVFLESSDVLGVTGVALALVMLASVAPARWAARLNVAEALREE
ncbi:Lipoprotein-releasing system transmembrane protein LolC [bacterium HR21]|nr:Lipoprotein-releasing system transmembrane protein LolC [bacterium HR21]